jgi:hypothetical protein
VQVVVEQPADGGPALGLGVVRVGQLGGVAAQQIMVGVPAGPGFGQQVHAGQRRDQRSYAVPGQSHEARRGGGADVRAGVQAKQPEQPGLGGVQRVV